MMKPSKPKVLTATVLVLSAQAAQALDGKVVNFDLPQVSVAVASTSGDTGVFYDVSIADTMLDVMISMPPPDIVGVTERPGFISDTGDITDTG
jgi:hypothetical protein